MANTDTTLIRCYYSDMSESLASALTIVEDGEATPALVDAVDAFSAALQEHLSDDGHYLHGSLSIEAIDEAEAAVIAEAVR